MLDALVDNILRDLPSLVPVSHVRLQPLTRDTEMLIELEEENGVAVPDVPVREL